MFHHLLVLLKKPPDDDVYFDIKPDTGVLTTKVVDDISDKSIRELYVHVLNVLPTLYLVFDTFLPFSSKNEDKVFNLGILISKEVKSPHLLSHWGFKVFLLINDYESPMMIYGGDIPIREVMAKFLEWSSGQATWSGGQDVGVVSKGLEWWPRCTLPTQGMRSIISTVSISPEVVVVAIIEGSYCCLIIGVVVVVMIIGVVVVVVVSSIINFFPLVNQLVPCSHSPPLPRVCSPPIPLTSAVMSGYLVGLLFSNRFFIGIPPGQGILGESTSSKFHFAALVFLFGLSILAMVAACASRAATILSATSCRMAAELAGDGWLMFFLGGNYLSNIQGQT
ncbi:hypothetical protein Tco_0687899 [Tanacetum coccineum]